MIISSRSFPQMESAVGRVTFGSGLAQRVAAERGRDPKLKFKAFCKRSLQRYGEVVDRLQDGDDGADRELVSQ